MTNPLRVAAVIGTMQAPSKTTALVELILKSLGSRTPIESQIIETHALASSLGPALEREQAGEQVERALRSVESADMLIAASPVFRGTFTGLFKHFFDLVDQYALANKPVLLVATGGSERHALVIDQALRPLFGFFQSWTAPMGIYLSSGDFDGTTVLNPEVYERIEVAVADVVPVALALASADDSMAGGAPSLDGSRWQTVGSSRGGISGARQISGERNKMHFPAPYTSRASMLEVMRAEHERFFKMVSNPDDWHAESRLPDWQVRDLVAHMIDETERYLDHWKMARGGQLPKSPSLADFREELKAGVLALRELPREEAIARLRAAAHATVVNFEALTEEEWSGFQIAHGFLGPLPASFFVPLELGHHALHAWDLGLGDRDAKLDEQSAGILVTQYIFNLWDYMFDAEAAKGVHIRYGIRIDGDWGGQWIVTVNGAEWAIEEADELRDVQAVVRYRHPSDMVLSSYFRIEAGEVSGEPGVIETGRRLFSRPV